MVPGMSDGFYNLTGSRARLHSQKMSLNARLYLLCGVRLMSIDAFVGVSDFLFQSPMCDTPLAQRLLCDTMNVYTQTMFTRLESGDSTTKLCKGITCLLRSSAVPGARELYASFVSHITKSQWLTLGPELTLGLLQITHARGLLSLCCVVCVCLYVHVDVLCVCIEHA